MRRWTRPLPAEPDRAILSNVWTTSTCYKPLEIERPRHDAQGADEAASCPRRVFGWFCRNSHLKSSAVCSPSINQSDERGRRHMAVSFKGAHFPQEIIPRVAN